LFELLLKDEIVCLPPGSLITLPPLSKNNDLPRQPGRPDRSALTNGPWFAQEALRTVFDPFALRTTAR